MRVGLFSRYLVALLLVAALLGALVYAGWQAQQRGFEQLAALSTRAMEQQAERALEQRGRAVAVFLGDNLINPMYFLDLEAIGQVVRMAQRQPDVSYVLVYDAAGKLLHDGSADIHGFGRSMDDAFAVESRLADALLVQRDGETIDVTQPLLLGEERLGGVRVGLSRQAHAAAIAAAGADFARRAEATAGERLRAQAVPALGLLLVALGMCWMVLRGLVRPIRRLAAQARAVERGRFDPPVDSNRSDEVGELIRAFNMMSRSIAHHDRDVRRLAYLDTLTGLPNRLMLRESLVRALVVGRSQGTGIALLFIDLDDFKRINDTLGHDAGDEALAQLARRLEDCMEAVRDRSVSRIESGDLVARFGGDEFVALIGGSDVRERARLLAERFLLALHEPLSAAGRPVHLNASIGITTFPDDADDASQLLKNGDIAMYQAKVHGKNCFRFFTNYMTRVAEDRLSLEQDLRAAMHRIELGGRELDVHYQPIVDLRTDQVIGAEALLRWHHPTRGLVPSALFVALAEDFGLIQQLGMFALRRACRDAMQWPAGEHAPFVAVNLSVKQLREAGLASDVARVLRECGMPPDRLHVELTESALLDDEPLAISTLGELRRLGVKIWLDDFGTGFSGLSHLRRVPVDGVKIDKSFTQDLLTDRDDLALTSAIIAMAGSLGITAVAEGIESASQLEILRGLKCDMGQGYWLGYPMSQSEVLSTLRSVPTRLVAGK